jgi:hypothetical protein
MSRTNPNFNQEAHEETMGHSTAYSKYYGYQQGQDQQQY